MEIFRIIYSIRVQLANGTTFTAELDRNGNAMEGRGPDWAADDGRPKDKERTIDLRRGDEVMWSGGWCKVKSIRAERAKLITESEIVDLPANLGYIYRMVDRR